MKTDTRTNMQREGHKETESDRHKDRLTDKKTDLKTQTDREWVSANLSISLTGNLKDGVLSTAHHLSEGDCGPVIWLQWGKPQSYSWQKKKLILEFSSPLHINSNLDFYEGALDTSLYNYAKWDMMKSPQIMQNRWDLYTAEDWGPRVRETW